MNILRPGTAPMIISKDRAVIESLKLILYNLFTMRKTIFIMRMSGSPRLCLPEA